MKKIFGILAPIVVALTIAAPANAASCTVKKTGYMSRNTCIIVDAKVAVVRVAHPTATVINTVTVTATTGGNTTTGNTIGGTIVTGNATASATITSDVNRTIVRINQ